MPDIIEKLVRIWTKDKVQHTISIVAPSLIISTLLYSQKVPVYIQDKISNYPKVTAEILAINIIILIAVVVSFARTIYSNNKIKPTEDDSAIFKNIRGLKIKELHNGEYEDNIAYCFHCKTPLSASHRLKQLECSNCGYKTSIQYRHLCLVLSELKGEETPEWWKKY